MEYIGLTQMINSTFGNVDDLYLFCSVVEEGSLLAASRKLHLPVSTMSRRLTALEQRLGMRLLEKQGRELVPTQTGLTAFSQLNSGMEQIELGLQALNAQSNQVEGQIRLVMPHNFYQGFVASVIEQFMRDHPKVKLNILLNQGFAAPETDRDLVITFDIKGMDGMIARPFFSAQHALFSSPEYLQKVGNINEIKDLASLEWISLAQDTDIPIYQGDKLIDLISVKPRLVVNDINSVIQTVENGFGIASLPLRHIQKSLNLIRILPDYHRGKRQSYLVYKQRTYQPKALTLLVNALIDRVSEKSFAAKQ